MSRSTFAAMFSGARGGGGGDDAAGPDAHLSDLFSRLHQSVEDRAHKRASKLCDEILKVSPGDVDASRAKVVALVESARYADAVAFLERSDDAELKASLAFEHAYALYRSHRLEEALAMVAPPRGSSPAAPREHRVAQLEAQLLYRLGRPAEAADAYERVLDSGVARPDGGGAAITTTANLVAALVASRRHADVAQALRRRDVSPKASFEIAFNVACGLIAQREFEDARAYLALAKAQGDAALRDEGLAPEEIAEEMLPAECASALCAAALGERDEAVRGYLGVLGFTDDDDASGTNAGSTNVNVNSHSRDHATLAVAATNLAALLGARGARGAECLRRAEKLCDADGVLRADVSALGVCATTRDAVVHNRAVALVHGNRLAQARETLNAVKSRRGGVAAAAALAAAVATRERKPRDARDALRAAERDARAGGDAIAVRDVLLTRAQLHASSGEYADAAAALREAMDADADGSLGGAPAAIATLAALLDLAGDARGADRVLDDMLAASTASGQVTVPPAATLRAADRALARGHAAEAAAAYASVGDAGGADDETRAAALAGAARAAAALGDLSAAERFAVAASERSPVAGASRALDADALEEALPASVVARAAELERKMASAASLRARGARDFQKRKPRRKKAPLYPKGFDPQNPGPPPDEDRWLPLRERASYKGKRRKQVAVRGAQGAANMSADDRRREFSGEIAAEGDLSAAAKVAAANAGKGKKGKKGRR